MADHEVQELLQTLRLKDENATKIDAAKKKVQDAATTEARQAAEEEVTNLQKAVSELQVKEATLRGKIGKGSAEQPGTTARPQSKVTFELPKPERYKRGDNFPKFCENFVEYVTCVSKVQCEDLSRLFLQLVDDSTKARLRKVALTPEERSDASKFTPLYMAKIAPLHQNKTFKNILADMTQKKTESVADFADRIIEMASRAYTDAEVAVREDACLRTMLRGVTNLYIKGKLQEDRSITTFEEAMEEAIALENVRSNLNQKTGTTPDPDQADLDSDFVLAIDENRQTPGSRDYEPGHVNNSSRESRHTYRRDDRSSRPTYNDSYRSQASNNSNQRGGYSNRRQNRAQGGRSSQSDRNRAPIMCYHCGGPNHFARDCRANLN